MIRTVAIISKPRPEEVREVAPQLVEWLKSRGLRVLLDQETAQSTGRSEPSFPRDAFPEHLDLALVVGGDGTLLAAARALVGRDVPILAVNLGALGFLTGVTLDQMYTSLEEVLAGSAREDTRRMLQADLLRAGESLVRYHALNDVVLNKAAIARILDFEVNVNGELVSNYKADGLILSTPTGSTGYSMAAGGPIIFPAVHALLVSPICSHTLNHRPLVVPDEAVVEVVVHSHKEAVFLTVDGQVGTALQHLDRLVCRRSPHSTRLIRPAAASYFEILRSKLKWGER